MAHSLEIRLERAGVYEVFCFPSADECMMCIKLDGKAIKQIPPPSGYSASFSDSIQMIEKEAATVGISVKDAKDSDCALTVHCDLVGEQRTPEDTPITAWRATLFVPYWVFDATGLGLKLSPDKYTLGAESEEVSLKNSISSKMEKFAEWKGIQEAAFAMTICIGLRGKEGWGNCRVDRGGRRRTTGDHAQFWGNRLHRWGVRREDDQ
eukprot:951473-Amorphochlora_amoeboformis.AAC.1